MGLFDGIEAAKERMDANYERPGHYIHRVDRVKEGVSRKGEEFLVIEKTVLHVFDDCEGSGHRAGEKVSHMMMARHDSFLGNVKAFVANSLGCSPEEVTADACSSICGDDQPMAGLVIECMNREIETKAGKPFTQITYRGQVPAESLIETLSPNVIAQYFPNDMLVRMVANEAS